MALPYPKTMGVPELSDLPREAHPGLIFTQFFGGYIDEGSNRFVDVPTDDKKEYLDIIINRPRASLDDEIIFQQIQLVESHGGVWWVVKNRSDSPFLTGIGINHPLENGFLWHPVYPVPYVPGSGLKGLLRSWFESSTMPELDRRTLLKALFGSDSKDPKQAQEDFSNGGLVFIDALPVKSWRIAEQIITPHMGKYYEKGRDKPGEWNTTPADWHEPNPIAFMALEEVSFLVGIFPSSTAGEVEEGFMTRIQAHMNAALEQLGLGAKTALGFGRFQPDDEQAEKLARDAREAQQVQQKEALLATLSEEERKIEEVAERIASSTNAQAWSPGQSDFNAHLEDFLTEVNDWDDQELLNKVVCRVLVPWIKLTGRDNYWKGGKAKGKQRWPRVAEAFSKRQC